MTSHERVMAVINGDKKPDRLGWLPELNERFIKRVAEQLGPVPQNMDSQTFVNRKIGADQLARAVAVRQAHSKVEVEQHADEGITIWHTPKGDLVQKQQRDEIAQTIYTLKHKIAGPQSFAAYHALLDDLRYEPDYDKCQQTIEKVGQTGLATIDAPATPLMSLIMWDMGIEPTLMAMFEHEAEMIELMQHMHEKNLEYYRIAAAGPGRVVRPMEDTSSMLTGPQMCAQHCVGYLNEYASICHENGKAFIVHMCGHLKNMLDVIKDVDLDGIEAATPGPTGDVELDDIRRVLGDVVILGGVDPTRYALQGPEQMCAELRDRLMRVKGDRRLIVGHEEVPAAANLETVQAVGRLIAETSRWFYK